MTSSARTATPGGVRILDKLRDDGRISAAQYETFFHQAKRTGERVEEAILESGVVTEADLLKLIASLYQTRFVGTERLAKADIDRATLDLVPRRVAERLQCVPILHERRTQTLSVVAFDLEEEIGKQLQVLTGLREVRVFVSRPAAVRAALRRFYGGDPQAFSQVGGQPMSYSLDAFDRGSGESPTRGGGLGGGGGFGGGGGLGGGALDLDFDDRTPAIGMTGTPAGGGAQSASAASAPRALPMEPLRIEMPRFEVAPDYESHLETVNVLVTLLDAARPELHGHSSYVARLAKQLAQKLALSDGERNALVLAAYLHDVGKASAYHLTALNVSRFDGHRLQAQRAYLAPVRVFESARLPELTIQILTHLFERYDGQGFPDRQAGKDIPLGSRMISIVETYADLTTNSKNPYRRTLSPNEAVDVLRQLSSQLFDPVLVDTLRQLVIGADTSKGGPARSRVLVLDPDRDETTVLELRLAEAAHEVVIVHDRAEAERALAAGRFDLVLSELELGGDDGFALLSAIRADPKTKDVPFVFLTRKADRESVARGFELGAADFLVKPASPEIVVAKAGQLIEQGLRKKSGGLAGALRDMALPDVIQALTNGRKSGLLRIAANGQVGEIHFLDGAIANASFGTRSKQEALYSMLALKDGDFALDPAFRPAERLIHESTEAILLEGMRRIDEGAV